MEKSEKFIDALLKTALAVQNLNKRSEKKMGISLVQWYLLRHLIDMPATTAILLAKTLGIDPSTLTQTLKRLGKKGYIFVTKDPTDSRKRLISITRKGKEKLEFTSQKIQQWPLKLSEIEKCIQS